MTSMNENNHITITEIMKIQGQMTTRRWLIATLLSCYGLAVQAQSAYDVNHDGKVDAADVTKVVDVIMGKSSDTIIPATEEAEMESCGYDAVTIWKDGVSTIIQNPDRVVLWNESDFTPADVQDNDVIIAPTLVEQAVMRLTSVEDGASVKVYNEEEYAEYDAVAKDLIATFTTTEAKSRQASTRGIEEEIAEVAIRDNGRNIFPGVIIEQLDWNSGQWGKTLYGGTQRGNSNPVFETFWGTFWKDGKRFLEVVFYHKGGFPNEQLAYLKLGQVNSGKIIGNRPVLINAGEEYKFITVCIEEYLPGIVNFFPLLVTVLPNVAQTDRPRWYLNPICVKSNPIVPEGWADMKFGTEFGKVNGISVYCNTKFNNDGTVAKDPYTGKLCKNMSDIINYQCVDLCKRYVQQLFPNITKTGRYGNAWEWPDERRADTENTKIPDKYIVFDNDGKTQVREGDLIVWKYSYWSKAEEKYKTTGHIGVVIKTTDTYISIAHQNGGYGSNARPIGSTLKIGDGGVIIDNMPGTNRSSIFGTSPKPVIAFIRAYHITEEKPDLKNTVYMTASTTYMDFGTIEIGNSVSKSFTITNSGTGTLTISSINPSSGAVYSVDKNSMTIGHGETKTVTVTFTPTSGNNCNNTLVIKSNAQDNPVWNIQLSGTGKDTPEVVDPTPQPAPTPVPSDPDLANRYRVFAYVVDDVKYNLYKSTDKSNSRTNGDGWVTYESKLALDIIKNGTRTTYQVGSGVYLDAGANNGQTPCMAIDFNARKIYIFTNSKSNGGGYSMDGFCFVSSLDNINFQKETVFTYMNDGWFAFFYYHDNKLCVRHFSYAGYYAKEAVRNSNGIWSNNTISAITPTNFENSWKANGTLFVIGNE